MKKISSKTTYFRKKIVPIILLINALILLFGFTIFDLTFKNLAFIFFPTLIFLFAWIFNFRKLEEVYLGNKYLLIKNEKVLFENILSIDKKSSFRYELTYQTANTVKSVIFMVDSFPKYPTSTPDFLKEIKEFIEKDKDK
ncbi:hypothetical protein [Flavobacterium sp. Root186]|uniref:hypothetical protein n=1 Tax=Flavobacterium sp. Root186 TaxID=1736485 RepID=UPI0006F3FAB9|nr:hypothetical protein [Flavobacterium sp. Root186]KRB56691.1 hypothetical protein ASD98_08345 [Flavobacterium sp. Root186]